MKRMELIQGQGLEVGDIKDGETPNMQAYWQSIWCTLRLKERVADADL